jgi:ABC-type Fe3+/spermidine/putrescine transport system ATPase subunit
VLKLDHIRKTFGSYRAVDDLSLEIKEGEIFALLGPSGCGKSTTLRQIAGLDQPDTGDILLKDKPLFSSAKDIFVPAQKRNMGMVFQSYAIWPHLSVYETVAYPLRLRRWSSADVDVAVRAIIKQVGLEGMEDRASPTLSGGQQQRVALARALVYKPDVLLLDEPFSNLDVKLREHMRVELKILQRRVGVSVVLVTHDQAEALSLADRLAVMNAGRIEQIGTPIELYDEPATPFVRDFIGQTTKFAAQITEIGSNGDARVEIGTAKFPLMGTASNFVKREMGEKVIACIRPERIAVASAARGHGGNELEGTVETMLFLGDRYECLVQIGGQAILAYVPSSERLKEGQRVPLAFPKEALTLWPN